MFVLVHGNYWFIRNTHFILSLQVNDNAYKTWAGLESTNAEVSSKTFKNSV